MRIRTFTAASAQAAMALVRNEMGPGAVIIAIDQAAKGQGVVVRAAVDETAPAPATDSAMPLSVEDRLEALLKVALAWHRPVGRAA